MPDVELALAPEGGPDDGPAAEKGDEETARQFILQVKKTMERCLEQRMNKAEMFRVIREEGLPTWIAFAVFKELREQNYGFFKEYYSMHDLRKQREKLGRLVQAYRTGGSKAAAAVETATTAAAMETDTTVVSMEWSDQQAEEAWWEGIHARMLASSTGGGDQFPGAALPQQAAHFPGGQQLHDGAVHIPGGQQLHDDEQQTVYNKWLLERQWTEETAPMLAQQQLHNDNEQSMANGMFQGVAWPQQAAHLLPGQQLQYHQQEQAAYSPADQQPRYLEQPVHLPAGQQQNYQEQHLPARQQLHYYQQMAAHLPGVQQLIFHQKQLMMASGGLQVAPLTSMAGLPSNAMVDSWPLSSQGGTGWGQEQQAEPPQQWWPGVGGDGGVGADPPPSSTLPGGQLPGSQNFRSSNAGSHQRPQ